MNKNWFTCAIKGSVKNHEKSEAAYLELFALVGSNSSNQAEEIILSYDFKQNSYDYYQTTTNNSSNSIETNSIKPHLFITQYVEVTATLGWTFQLMSAYFSTVDSFEDSFNLQTLLAFS